MGQRWSTCSLAAAVVALGLCACQAGQPRAISPATPSPSTTSTTTVAQLDALLVDRWTAAYRASIAAAKNPTSQGLIAILSDYFSDDALTSLLSTYSAYTRDGLTSVGDIDLGQPSVVSVSGATAVIRTCAVNKLAVIHASTGQPLPGPQGSTSPVLNGVKSTMTLAPSGVWKVSDAVWKDGSCAGV